jgi:transposase
MAAAVPRPSKFTEARKQRILAILAAGGSRREAARAAGIDAATLRLWLRTGERSISEGRWGRFLADVRGAEAGQRLVGLERDREELAWAMGVLEREWSGPDPDGPPEGPIVVQLHLPEEEE